MKRSVFAAPDDFSLSPLLSLLPTKGKVGKLEALTSSLFARYEKVLNELDHVEFEDEVDKQRNKLTIEAEMLKQVLEWLEVKPN
jgi:hypothetical protein